MTIHMLAVIVNVEKILSYIMIPASDNGLCSLTDVFCFVFMIHQLKQKRLCSFFVLVLARFLNHFFFLHNR
jgi:hypothetical protein